MNNEINDLKNLIVEQQTKINQVYASVEKLRKYFLWTLIITVAAIILPLIGMLFAIPTIIGNYTAAFQGL